MATITTVADLIDPEVMADMLSAKLPQKIKVIPYAKVDTTLSGQPGDTITVPKFAYIGDAEDVAEGVEAGTTKLTASTTQAKVKKAVKNVTITDEAVLSGYGDPVGEINKQIVKSIAAKVDNDGMEVLQKATLVYDGSADTISYSGIVNAVDKFEEEDQLKKVMFVHPKQVTQLRLDADFKDINKYPLETLMTGVIGEICGCQVIPSKKVPLKSGAYLCPIIKVESDTETDMETPALTYYIKRNATVEIDRQVSTKSTMISADEHYTVALSNESKVVIAKFKATATV